MLCEQKSDAIIGAAQTSHAAIVGQLNAAAGSVPWEVNGGQQEPVTVGTKPEKVLDLTRCSMENKTAALKGVKFGPFEGTELPSLTTERT